jgi:DNA polymerase-3 subunit gamma/tau
MSYTVLARRYRSQTFDDVVGQDALAQTLKNAIQADRVAHAYLFCGTRGVGKTTMARILAKSLNCLNAKEQTTQPCLKCDSCVSVNIGEDIDVIEIDGASNNGVENIRQLRENANYRPARARNKIYIIDEIHMLSTGAFNALLKILEEPPAHIKFIFATTEPNKVLPTIQSRCQRFDFAPIGPETIVRQLDSILKIEKITFEKEFLSQLARLANGSMRDALSLLDQLISTGQQPLTLPMLEQLLGKPGMETLNQLVRHVASAAPGETLKSIETLLNQGQTALQIAESLVEIFRDIMVLKTTGSDDVLLLSGSKTAFLKEMSQTFDIPWLVFAITTFERLRWTLRNSETARALLEATLIRLAMSEHFISLDALADQLRGKPGASAPAAAADLKKKTIVSPGNSSVPQNIPVQSLPVEIPVEQTSTADSDSVEGVWSQLTAKLQAQNGQTGVLSGARPGQFYGNAMVILFSNSFALEMSRKKDDLIRSILKGILGRDVTVQYELAKAPDSKTAAPPPSAPPSPGTRINRQQQEEALSDPAIQMMIRGLAAKNVQIDRVDEEPAEPHDTEETSL